MTGAELLVFKVSLPVLSLSAIVAQAVADDPVGTWVGVGGQVVAWTVVGYFAQALLNGKMVVRSTVEQQKTSEANESKLQALLADAARREDMLRDLVSELRRDRASDRSGSHRDRP